MTFQKLVPSGCTLPSYVARVVPYLVSDDHEGDTKRRFPERPGFGEISAHWK